jgi:hypothetical protein
VWQSVLAIVSLAALVAVGVRQLRHANGERHELLGRYVGRRLTLVTLHGKVFASGLTGTIRSVSNDHVVIESQGREQVVPIAAVQEVWRGRRQLGRW